MSAYLQRLLARTAPGFGNPLAAPSIPVAPLASPLADHDQRLSLPEFDAPVPSMFDEPQIGDPGQPQRSGAQPANEGPPTARNPAKAQPRLPPELRLVGQPRPEPAEAPSPAEPPAKPAVIPGPGEAPALTPSPLDIQPADLQPIVPLPVDDGEEPATDSSEKLHGPPEPAEKPASALPVPAEVSEAGEPRPQPETVEQRRSRAPSPVHEVQPAPRRGTPVALAEPGPTVGEKLPTPVIADSPEPASRERNQRAAELEARLPEPRPPAGISIEQIIIDVHEPQQSSTLNASGRTGPPATAAAASIIGPLPVRRSTISLFGMRRR